MTEDEGRSGRAGILDCDAISVAIDEALAADVLEDAVEGEAEAHKEKAREQVRGKQGRVGHFDRVGAVWRHDVVNEGNAHHVQQAAAKRGLTARTRGFAGRTRD